ncbi:MAG: hypothetical protein ACFCU7_18585 [Pleurocapsa sp.]
MWTISVQDMLKRNYKTAYKSLPRPYLLDYPHDPGGSDCQKYNRLVDQYNELIQCSAVKQLANPSRLLTYSLVIEDHYILKTYYNCTLKYHPKIWEMFQEVIEKIIKKYPTTKKTILDNTVRYSQELAQQIIVKNCQSTLTII